jgi:hypothetical protein
LLISKKAYPEYHKKIKNIGAKTKDKESITKTSSRSSILILHTNKR